MKIRRSIEIAAMSEEIWPYLVEPEKILKWCLTLKTIRHTSEQRSGIRTPFYFEERAVGRLMKINFIVTEWILNESVAFEMTSGNLVKGYAQRYTIVATPSGSLLTCSENVKLPWGIIGKVGGLFRHSVSDAHLKRMLVKLKSLAEA